MDIRIVWLFFTGAAILGMVGYDVAIKLASAQINVFVFTACLAMMALLCHILVLAGYKYLNPQTNLNIDAKGYLYALAGGLGLTVMNLGFFVAVKYGGLSVTNAVLLIGGLVITVILGYFAFNEYLDYKKVLGILLGILSIYFLVT